MASSSCLARILICPLLCLAHYPHPQEEAFRLFLQHISFPRAFEDHALLSGLQFLIFITYKTEKVHYVQEFYLQHCTFRSLRAANAAKQRALVAVDHLSSGIPLYLLLLSTFIVLMQFKRRKMVIDKMLKKSNERLGPLGQRCAVCLWPRCRLSSTFREEVKTRRGKVWTGWA